MFHLFKHSEGSLKGKYDFAFVSKGKYICGSNQGYGRKAAVLKAILSVVSNFSENYGAFIQDDTFEKPTVNVYYKKNGKVCILSYSTQKPLKPSKPYIPNKK